MRNVKAGNALIDWRYQKKPMILRYVEGYSLEEYQNAVDDHKTMLIGRVLLEDKVSLLFYEKPQDVIGNYNSTLEIDSDEDRRVYNISQILNSKAMSLGYIGIVRSANNEVLIVCNYDAQPSEFEQGFVVIRLQSGHPSFYSLPLTNYGKVIISTKNLGKVELWSASKSGVGTQNELATYSSQSCEIEGNKFNCGEQTQLKRRVAPAAIIDPAIWIR